MSPTDLLTDFRTPINSVCRFSYLSLIFVIFFNYRGSKDGDVCVVEVKKMEVCHWSKRLHLGSSIESLEFCPSER